jgi:ribonuclease HII
VSSPTLQWEEKLGYPALHLVGVDEVGRGCLAGPVVAGAVLLPPVIDYSLHPWVSEIADSKLLKPAQRERLAPLIEAWAPAWAIGVASVEEIDEINIYHASHLAMRRAIEQVLKNVSGAAARILVDGNVVPKNLPAPATAIVKGDMQCLSIAAGSIIAKVWRDREMDQYDRIYPEYGFSFHKGYATPKHQAALQEVGACPIHRRSFAPVAAALGLLIRPGDGKTAALRVD